MGVLKHLFSREYPIYEDESGPKFRNIRYGKDRIFVVDYVSQGISHIGDSEVRGAVRKLDRGLGSYKITSRVS